MNWETELELDRAYGEMFEEHLAQAHIDNGDEQCAECGEWVDEDDIVLYQGEHLCPKCRREYILADLKNLADEIQLAFDREVGRKVQELIEAMGKK